jgi:FtsH-binding integral membrane protein
MSYSEAYSGVQVEQRSIVNQAYTWMALGLLVTAATATLTANSPALLDLIYRSAWTYWILIIAEFGLVVALSAAINRISQTAAIALFLAYAALNGLTLSAILLYYTANSIGLTFLVTAGMFGAMSVIGFVTKRDLTGVGNVMFMLLIGLILGSIINIFLASSTFYWIMTYAGVIVFAGLAAYDAQKIKRISEQAGTGESRGKLAIMAALALYLDFVNMFLFLLRIFGRR